MMDALKQAKGNLERTEYIIDDTENCDPMVSAAVTQAAALIAIAERLDKLIDLLAARVDDGAFRVEAWNYDARRELDASQAGDLTEEKQ